MDDIVHLDMRLTEGNAESNIKVILSHIRPTWNREHVNIEVYPGGLNNLMWLATDQDRTDDRILVRIHKPHVETYVNLDKELRCLQPLLHRQQLCQPIYCIFKNGLAYAYAEGSILNGPELYQPHIYQKVIDHLHRIHSVNLLEELGSASQLINLNISDMIKPIQAEFMSEKSSFLDDDINIKREFPDRCDVNDYVESAQALYSKVQETFEKALVHGDPQIANIIYNKTQDTVVLIDWDLVGFDIEPVDIAIMLTRDTMNCLQDKVYEMLDDPDFLRNFLTYYLETHPKYSKELVMEETIQKWTYAVHVCIYLSSCTQLVWSLSLSRSDNGEAFLKFARKSLPLVKQMRNLLHL